MRDPNELIDECIDHLCDDNIKHGGAALVELSLMWAKAGLGLGSFTNIRKYIICEAIARTCPLFIKEKITVIERQQRDSRNGTIE